MSIIGIDHVEFIVENSEEADSYLLAWGLEKKTDALGTRYECVDGSSIGHIEAVQVDQENRPFPTIRELIWGVSDQAALNTLIDDLSRDHAIDVDAEGTAHTHDYNGLKIGLRVTRKRSIPAEPTQFNTPGAPSRIDKSAPFYDRAVPQEISHIVFGCKDVVGAEAFYRERLGFHVSDRYIDRGVFMRGPAIGHHHNVFLLDDGEFTFNHIAFKVRDIHEMIGGGQAFGRKGAETLIGPGRHYASSGCFWYFKSPFGGAMEYVADEDVLTPAWQPSDLAPSPERFSEWAFVSGHEMGALKKEH